MLQKKASQKPLVVHVYATEFDREGEGFRHDVCHIEKMGMEVADKVIVVSDLIRNSVIEKYKIKPDKIETVYNAVEVRENKKDVIFKRNADEKIVTFLGKISFQIGLEYFIEAANKVLQKMKNVRFVIPGSGDIINRMIKRVTELKIRDRFYFTGFIKGNDVDKMFANSDIYVMSSVSENFSISPLEVMHPDVPVIIGKQSAISKILNHTITIDFGNIDAIANAIYGLLNYSALSKMFSHYQQDEIDKMKWKNTAFQVKEIYSTVFL